ncbi:MAG TPA: hypothetical protein VGQ99_04400 [Tepidisphaeraceae bacterium]|jgi:hypothetical protein|nr:hypothetical protein [Tepidisphaeraceae bacterium]HEV8604580.1 hypothetical protein [Tepidisphaeraceae bacterium]
MSVAISDVLAKALEQQAPAIISSGEGAERRDLMVQFTGWRADSKSVGFWARVHEGDAKVIDRLIKSADPVGVSFNTKGAKINFQTALLKKRRHNLIYKLLLLRWPEKIAVLEQRQKPRQWVPERYRIQARIQALSPKGETMSEAPVRIWDIGLEGASLICPDQPFSLSLNTQSTLKVIIRPPDSQKEHAYLATHRHLTRLSDEKLRLGVQFTPSGDPTSAPAQRALKAMVDELNAFCGQHEMLDHLRQPGGQRIGPRL